MNEKVETDTRLPAAEPAFHADDTLEVADYRTVSALAIVSLLFGLASPLCIAWPLFMAIALVGAALSAIAIARIDASDGALAGRWAATAGLVLCVLSGTGAVSHDLVMRTIRSSQAEAFGGEWIELLLAGNTEEAFQLTVAANRHLPPREPGTPAPTETPYDHFLESPIVTELTAAGGDFDIRLEETLSYERQPRRQFVIQQKFNVVPRGEAAEQKRNEVVLTLQRSRLAGERLSRWLVVSYARDSTDPAAYGY